MPRAATGYRSLLRTPGAAAFFFTATAGRVGIAMTGLGLVWLLHARTGSYGTAGLAAAGFALAEALIGPQLARLVDSVTIALTIVAALVLLFQFFWAIVVMAVILAGGYIMWENLHELRH